ncbi:MAG: rRNA maturation RNase YbeY [Clostridia bacterium]|nr:rRNA maturation RNase YbeY [Clostridia bacterium]
MKSIIEVTGRVSSKYKELAEKVALDCIKCMSQPDKLEVAIKFVSEKEMIEINSNYRGISKVTDVLSFPAVDLKVGEILDLDDEENVYLIGDNGLIHFGDMAICMVQLKKQAKEYGVSNESELKKLVIHSMLHFMGYDHIKDSDYEIMNKKEMVLDSLIKIKVGE